MRSKKLNAGAQAQRAAARQRATSVWICARLSSRVTPATPRRSMAACGVPDTVAGVMWAAVALRTSRIANYGDEERIGA